MSLCCAKAFQTQALLSISAALLWGREAALVEQLAALQARQQRAHAAALEELPATLRQQSKLLTKQRLQDAFKLLFEARGFSDYCGVSESFYRILNGEFPKDFKDLEFSG